MKQKTIDIKIGSQWVLVNRSPFASPVTATVVEVKAGWVRYQMGSGDENGASVREFLKYYEPADVDWPGEIDA